MKGRRKADGEGLLTSILCDASDGLTLSERDKLSDHQNEGRTAGSAPSQTPDKQRLASNRLVRPVPGQARSQTAPGQGLDVRW